MKNSYSYLAVFLGLFSIISMGAQNQLSKSEQAAFKEEVQSIANKTTTITSDFEQIKHIDVLDNDIVSEGKLLYKAPQNIRWEYTSPTKYTVIFKDDKLYLNNQGKKDEVNLAANKIFRSFNALIVNSVKGSMFDDDQFDMMYYKSERNYNVSFTPKDKRMRKFIQSFELNFEGKTKQVTQIKMVEPNGDYTLVVFKNRKNNSKVLDTVFQVN
jgi:outer membrane lipoprotein-sorting protein